jgi:hypothetical protein
MGKSPISSRGAPAKSGAQLASWGNARNALGNDCHSFVLRAMLALSERGLLRPAADRRDGVQGGKIADTFDMRFEYKSASPL